jgi:hypothetical protein
MTLARERGLDLSGLKIEPDPFRTAVNHSAVADLVTTVIRKDGAARPWMKPPEMDGWQTSALMNPEGTKLRQFLAVSNWSEDREFYEKHSWYGLGEIAHYRMPVEFVIAVLGPMTGGRRHNAWAKGLLHVRRSHIRFKLHKRSTVEGFADSWSPIWREEHAEISRKKWLEAMLEDKVLEELLFVVEAPVPGFLELAKIRDLAARQLRLSAAESASPRIPERQLSTCHNPIHPCPFRRCCWMEPESTPDQDAAYERV